MLGYQEMRTCYWDRYMKDMLTLSLYLVGAGLIFKSSTLRCWGKSGYIHARISSNEDMFLGQMKDMPTLSLYLVGAGLIFKSSTIRCWGKSGYIHARILRDEDMLLGQIHEGHARLILVSCRCWTDI